jgi:acetyl-CoA C-acetyltransferase
MHIHILGTHTTHFGELWNQSLSDLGREAITRAVTNSNLDPTDIEAVFVANKAAASFEGQHHLNALVSDFFPHHPPAIRVEAACASGGMAVLTAEYALLAGQYRTVLVVGLEKMTDTSSEETTHILSGAAHLEKEYGSTFPALYGLLASAHMREYGTTREQLSSVAVKNHSHALHNPAAQFHKAFTLEQVSGSQLVADPLRLLDCSPISDGAAAVVLSTKSTKGAPRITGWGHAQDSLDLASRSSLTCFSATQAAAQQAYKQSCIKPKQVELAEVHDCFTIAELLAVEDLGLIEKGKSGAATLAQHTTHSGVVVVNPSGGLKACGHPVGATGVKQIAFLAEQLKTGAAKVALAHNVGGCGATAVVHILEK